MNHMQIIFASLITFSVYVYNGNEFNSTIAYSCLAIFNILLYPMTFLLFMAILTYNSIISFRRVGIFTKALEIDQNDSNS